MRSGIRAIVVLDAIGKPPLGWKRSALVSCHFQKPPSGGERVAGACSRISSDPPLAERAVEQDVDVGPPLAVEHDVEHRHRLAAGAAELSEPAQPGRGGGELIAEGEGRHRDQQQGEHADDHVLPVPAAQDGAEAGRKPFPGGRRCVGHGGSPGGVR